MNENKEQQKKEDKDIKTKLQECEKEKENYLAGWQRARADFLNYKKQEIERFDEFINSAKAELILEVLKIFDNLERAIKQIPQEQKGSALAEGMQQIKSQFKEFLKKEAVEEVKTEGKHFDPNFHEAVEQAAEQDKESGAILEVLQKGYTINGQLLRPAKVKVAK